MGKIVIDYGKAYENHMKADAEKALKLFLNGEEGVCFTLFPQALNPFLKTLESLGIWRQAMVVPAMVSSFDGRVKPAYIVVKTSSDSFVSSVETELVP